MGALGGEAAGRGCNGEVFSGLPERFLIREASSRVHKFGKYGFGKT